MNPSNFMLSSKELLEAGKIKSRLNYQFKIMNKLLQAFEMDTRNLKDTYYKCLEDPSQDFISLVLTEQPIFPFCLKIEKLNIIFKDLILRTTKTKAWELFTTVKNNNPDFTAIVIFNTIGKKNWVLHNIPVTRIKNEPRILIPSGEDFVRDSELISFNKFLKEINKGVNHEQ